ncbi:hypothetical protein [Janthinobacterium fluminis]|uniref:Surface antigen domain-containing protein n=1 Tax=Janthinobacterium fluminis TaxID=2987524 RepID=A0ABT5K2N1_9BURK|nr:hypothetical protein [Janthinobacterium fluminis]MDC8758991.1 hypothetical protein [Janthinobacterium fluminis]
MSSPIRHLCAAVLGAVALMNGAVAAEPAFLDDVSIVAMTADDKQALKEGVLHFLDKNEDGGKQTWRHPGNAGMTADLSVDKTVMLEDGRSFIFCRQLGLVLRAGGKEQDLSRKTCTQKSGKFDIAGLDPVAAVHPPFLSDVSVAQLNKKEKASLLAAAVEALKGMEEGRTAAWSNKGLGNPQPLRVALTVSNTATKPGGFRDCRDLTMVLSAKNTQQTLVRRSCEGRTGWMDIEPGHEHDD